MAFARKKKKDKAALQPPADTKAGGNMPKIKKAHKAASQAKLDITAAVESPHRGKTKKNKKKKKKKAAKEIKTLMRARAGQGLHLCHLPQYIQTRIYRYAVTKDHTINITANKVQGSNIWRMPEPSKVPGLAATCKRLRGLALALYFKFNDFRFMCGETAPMDDYSRVCAMDTHYFSVYGKLLTSLEIHVDWRLVQNTTAYKAIILVTMKPGAAGVLREPPRNL